jgi:hypothetical protein
MGHVAERASQPYKHTAVCKAAARIYRKEPYGGLLSPAVHFIGAAGRNLFKSLSLITGANCLQHHAPAAGSEMRL